MRFTHVLTTSIVSLFLISFLAASPALGFIEREYTIREVLDACTNIVFGEVKSVDTRRLQAIITVKEDVKGKSNLKEIKMNFQTGQYKRNTSPRKMVRLLEQGMPIIVFYRDHYGIDSMCFIDDTWFQMRLYQGRSRNLGRSGSSWWSFTHIDPMMNRTFKGKTKTFQNVVRDILDGKMWVTATKDALKILVLTGNSTSPTWGQTHVHTNTMTYEYQALRNIKKVGKRPTALESTKIRTLPNLQEANILWLGYEEISSFGRYLLPKKTETAIKNFVKNGGIVIVSGQDSTMQKPCGVGWLQGNLTGVESPPDRFFEVTNKEVTLFTTPNKIQSGKIYTDDAWVGWDKNDEIFATTPERNELVIGARQYGKGLYIITSLRNDNQYTVSMNKGLMENIIHYAANRIERKNR
ncbi:MAG: hypothetical protein OXM61_06000 [Candidatus Poribacteria bacterium]|nr:hypothetical protein [Candidatus Poribacteria bacterium]